VPNSTRPDANAPASRRASLGSFALIAVAAIAARLPFLLRADRFFNSDEAVEGLMARHVLAGEHPLFLWGQRYKGVPEIYLDAVVFRFMGSSVIALKAVTLACFVVFLCLNFALLDRLFSRRIAWMATAFLIAGPPTLVLWTLSGSAEIVMTFLAGTVLLLAIERWLRPATGETSTRARGPLLLAAFAAGFGLWVQQYILYYVASLVVAAAIVTPGWRIAGRETLRRRLPPWTRAVVTMLAAIAVLYTVLGLIASFTSAIDIKALTVHITATHPQKMWWIAGALMAMATAISVCAIFRTQVIAPGLAFLVGYLPAIVGRIGNTGLGAPIARLDFYTLRAALPDIMGVMLPMLFGWRDPDTARTVFPILAFVIVAIVAVSYWRVFSGTMTPFFHVFPVIAIAMFFVSGSYIDAQTYRYLMPIYAALPVVYAVGVDSAWRAHRAAGFAVLGVALLIFGAQQIDWYVRLRPDLESQRTIACLDAAGARFAKAGYWQSYKLTFLTDERIVVVPIDGLDRYPPYDALAADSRTIDQIGCH
jgi:hypothetical protein